MEPIWPPQPAITRRPRQAAHEEDQLLAWFVELCLYPERFFRERLTSVGAWLTNAKVLVLIGLIGVERMVDQHDRLQRFLSVEPIKGSPGLQALLLLVWVPTAGALAYHLGKLAFRVRLFFCGADADYDRLTTVFAATSAAWCVPAAAIGLPAWLLDVPVLIAYWPLISLAGWLAYVDYIAVRVAFGAARWRAITWFVIAPAVGTAAAFAWGVYRASN